MCRYNNILPVALIWQWCISWMPPLAHLKGPQTEQWVNPHYTRWHGKTKKLLRHLSGITTIHQTVQKKLNYKTHKNRYKLVESQTSNQTIRKFKENRYLPEVESIRKRL
jgi:hypothetical protein